MWPCATGRGRMCVPTTAQRAKQLQQAPMLLESHHIVVQGKNSCSSIVSKSQNAPYCTKSDALKQRAEDNESSAGTVHMNYKRSYTSCDLRVAASNSAPALGSPSLCHALRTPHSPNFKHQRSSIGGDCLDLQRCSAF